MADVTIKWTLAQATAVKEVLQNHVHNENTRLSTFSSDERESEQFKQDVRSMMDVQTALQRMD